MNNIILRKQLWQMFTRVYNTASSKSSDLVIQSCFRIRFNTDASNLTSNLSSIYSKLYFNDNLYFHNTSSSAREGTASC